MVPIHRDLYEVGIQQPLLFINSYDFQWAKNVQQMMKLSKLPDENGMSSCRVLTLRYVGWSHDSDVMVDGASTSYVTRGKKFSP